MKKQIFSIILLLSVFAVQATVKTKSIYRSTNDRIKNTFFDIRDYGAKGDGKTLNTKAFQNAIDACNKAGGGTVLVTGGKFLTGTIFFRSNVCLQINAGAVLLGSANIKDYPNNTDRHMYRGEAEMDRCLIVASDVKNISITGTGKIDGQGKLFPNAGDPQENRPKILRFLNSTNIRLRDITIESPASWTTEWRYCNDIVVDGITIFSQANWNGDGLDFDGCTDVRVSNSSFDTSDDSICLQTSMIDKPSKNVVITNCVFSSKWAGIRIGLLSRGNFENIVVTNCIFNNHSDSGLKIQMCEGGEMKNMIFSNLVMKNVPRPVFMTFTKQNAWVDANNEDRPMKTMTNIQFNNIIVETDARGKDCAFVFTGLPGHPIENITLNNIQAVFPGGGTIADSKNILKEFTSAQLDGRWPEYFEFKNTVPAFGLYMRHVKGVRLINTEFTTIAKDERPAVVLIDVVK
ncbi:glycoside hydrolase family 28 protein [Pedobacter changchengzhani]|uniref:Glycoside hydrolase family 28 protein n=1 Tax=Pedobacter changchengzhani TaxID=2529274 RepID=A0A4R5MKN7_9SPHI|nr:glycosyl hydrolase family 28 protein [Pedobacter changchengzhani]TDG36234.1 glycoside hydrolase family 28 protein [Pedobacter changchengzhani]